jgi:RNA-directed DNA polymerase
MKRIGFLFDKAFTQENLYQAFIDASRNKHGKRACFQFARRLGRNLERLHTALHNGTYRPQPYYTFMVYEPKPRQIFAPSFADLVVQHSIYRIIYPIFNKTFIDQSFACRKGKGTHAAADYAQAAMQASPADSFTLKLDIRKFFYRINRDNLRTMIERKIKDRRFVDVMMLFADHGEPVGIPIGNLLSQIYALIYMNGVDHFAKRVLKAKRYYRYVDDFVIFGISKESAIASLHCIIAYINDIGLELSKYTIAAIKRGINFVGYRTWTSKRFIRNRSLFVSRRALRLGKIDSAISILGHNHKGEIP